jgi:hypothetical protein
MKRASVIASAIASTLLSALFAGMLDAEAATPAEFPDARASDPTVLGWMIGTPPPPDKLIRYEDGSFYRFPQWRWSFSNWRQLHPTIAVERGVGAAHPLYASSARIWIRSRSHRSAAALR